MKYNYYNSSSEEFCVALLFWLNYSFVGALMFVIREVEGV